MINPSTLFATTVAALFDPYIKSGFTSLLGSGVHNYMSVCDTGMYQP